MFREKALHNQRPIRRCFGHTCTPIILLALIPCTLGGDGIPAAKFPAKPQLIVFLTSTVEWYRYFSVEGQMATDPADLLFLQDSRAIARQVVTLSFTFTRAAVAYAAATAPAQDSAADQVSAAAGPVFQNLIAVEGKSESAALEASQNIEQLQDRRTTARGAERNRIDIQIADAQSQASLLQSMSTTLRGFREFVRSTDSSQIDGGGLEAFVDGLEQTVPEIAAAAAGGAPIRSAQGSDVAALSSRPTSGILGTIARVSALAQKRRRVDEIIARTDQLAMTSQSLLTPLAAELNGAFQDPELLAAPLAANDLGQLQKQSERLKVLMNETEKISPAITALAKQRILLTLYKSRLAEWNASVVNQYRSAWKDVMFQGAALCGALGIVIAINALVRKVTSGHIHAGNGRHAILVGQRIVLWLSLSIIAFLAFALDLKSLATFLGIASAGLAVAMQNVILAVAGYFLLVGKLHIRIGDRVQISGVSGEVIEIGLLQFRLRELGAAGDPPAGRIVSFSNSFIFLSPATGLFKQTDVPQHNITLSTANRAGGVDL